jgi:hypothetical protein
MAQKINILKVSGEYDRNDMVGVHGTSMYCGDPATLCGLYFIDGIDEFEEVKSAISCLSCISVLEGRVDYKKRNGKWY